MSESYTTRTAADGSTVSTQTRCHYPPPLRVWEWTGEGWASREWRKGEKLQYAREVLGQEGGDQS